MRKFDYTFLRNLDVDMGLFNVASKLEGLKEKDVYRQKSFPNSYLGMENAARMQSIFGSNAIEGIFTTDDRLNDICMKKVEPLGHDEKEIAGYRDALDIVHSNYKDMKIDTTTILELHRIIMSYSDSAGGMWKDEDNIIGHIREDGTIEVHFRTLPYKEVPDAMERLVMAYNMARQDSSINRLLLIACFVQDFLSIHPFIDGNGRASRLLTLLLLYKEGYDAGKYVSIEQTIYRNKSQYYRALAASSENWHEGNNDYLPFIRNFMDTLFLCYKELDRRFTTAVGEKQNKSSRVEFAALNSLMPISKKELHENLPDVSEILISKVLAKLVKEERLVMIGAGSNVRYMRK